MANRTFAEKIRICVRFFLFFMILFACFLGMIPIAIFGKIKSLDFHSRKLGVWVLRITEDMLCGISGLEIHAPERFLKNLPQGALVVSNHVSCLDIVICGALFHCGFVSKGEVSSWPILGSLARIWGVIFVDRNSVGSRSATLRRLKKEVAVRRMCVFPEGTTTPSHFPSEELWKHGSFWSAIRAGVPVVAVALHYEDQNEVAWIGDETLLGYLSRLFARKITKVGVEFQIISHKDAILRMEGIVTPEAVRTFSDDMRHLVTELCVCSMHHPIFHEGGIRGMEKIEFGLHNPLSR